MGAFADDAAERLRDAPAGRVESHTWTTGRYVGRTPVDVAGDRQPLLLVELEWLRADSANNAVKLFCHLAEGGLDGDIRLFQAFTRYYDLQSGGVSSKRKNAEFVGERIAVTADGVACVPLTPNIDPPKLGGQRPNDWKAATERTADRIEARS